jgi:SAM-dependent methyltransferase
VSRFVAGEDVESGWVASVDGIGEGVHILGHHVGIDTQRQVATPNIRYSTGVRWENVMQEKQELFYAADTDYRAGSPHLAHYSLYVRLVGILRQVLRDLEAAGLPLSVLEIGAGHGGYTEPALAAGCQVTAVEMSRPSLARLAENFGTNANFKGVFDPDGTLAQTGSGFSLVLYVSVLHHIPDYLEALTQASRRLVPGGALLSLQDPIWYPRQSRLSRAMSRTGYYAWRLPRGNWRRGAATVMRRSRGLLDEDEPSDMVEYHVVRNGVDECAIRELLLKNFGDVQVIPYWSNQSAAVQWLGTRLRLRNTFGILATGYRGPSPNAI